MSAEAPAATRAPRAPQARGRNAAQVLVELLARRRVTHTFGIPAGVSIPIFDALVDSPIHHVLTRHEQGATHMADAGPAWSW